MPEFVSGDLCIMDTSDPERADALQQLKKTLLETREWEAKLKALRQDIKGLQREYDTTEDNIKALQSVGQIIGEVLKQLDDERCKLAGIWRRG
jgi:ATP-dependent 26S proteasome regulatory subunit